MAAWAGALARGTYRGFKPGKLDLLSLLMTASLSIVDVARNSRLQGRNTLRSSDRLCDVQALVERPPVGLRHLSRRLRTFAKSNRRRVSC